MVVLITLFIAVTLVIMALTAGFQGCDTYAIYIDLNRFTTPYYHFGVTHHPEYSEEAEVSVLTIGLIVINITFEFYRFYTTSEDELEQLHKDVQDGSYFDNR